MYHPEAKDISMAYTTVTSQPIGFFSSIGAAFKSFIASAQHSRMLSVLSQMSDAELELIGITRADIPDYTEKLLSHGA